MTEKVLGLFSGGIDSPVAMVMASRTFDVVPVHFCLYPLTSKESATAAFDSLRTLKEKNEFEKAVVYPWAPVLSEIEDRIKSSYACVTCRRLMLKISSEICKMESATGIVTGESLGQKASQTIQNIAVTSRGASYPVIRPLIGLNKNEIVKLSREWGLWNEDHAGCCNAVPNRPSAETEIEKVNDQIAKIDFDNVFQKDRILEIRSFERNSEDYVSAATSQY